MERQGKMEVVDEEAPESEREVEDKRLVGQSGENWIMERQRQVQEQNQKKIEIQRLVTI